LISWIEDGINLFQGSKTRVVQRLKSSWSLGSKECAVW
jgi:hypothetical protein